MLKSMDLECLEYNLGLVSITLVLEDPTSTSALHGHHKCMCYTDIYLTFIK